MLRHAVLALMVLCIPAAAGVRVVVPAHDIARGAVISDSDLAYSTVANTTMSGIATSPAEVTGMEARRTLRAGETLRAQDLRHPVLIAKGSTVTMVFEAPGVLLTATGRAMSEAGLGETITIQNPVSFRKITGTVIGPGQVRAETGAARIAALDP